MRFLRAPAPSLRIALLCGAIPCLVALASSRAPAQSWTPAGSGDYEDCAEKARTWSTPDRLAATLSECDTRFPGRRKPEGGYTYYDFMQNRHFDIAGPVPTAQELKQIDHAYIGYLATRNAGPAAPDAAQSQPKLAAPGFKAAAVAGPTGKPSSAGRSITRPGKKRSARRTTRPPDCEKSPLACGWANFTARIKSVSSALFEPPSKELLVSRLQHRDR